MLLLTPVFMLIVFGSMLFRGGSEMSAVGRALLPYGAMAMTLLSFVQLIGNQFGFDRGGLPRLRFVAGIAARHPARQEPGGRAVGAGHRLDDGRITGHLSANEFRSFALDVSPIDYHVFDFLPDGELALDRVAYADCRWVAQTGEPTLEHQLVAVSVHRGISDRPVAGPAAARDRGALPGLSAIPVCLILSLAEVR